MGRVSSTESRHRFTPREPALPATGELAEFLSAVEKLNPELFEVASIVANTGIRSEELCALRWCDVDFASRCISVASMKAPSSRRIPIGGKVSEILAARRQRHSGHEFVLGRSPRQAIERVGRQCRLLSARICSRTITLRMLRMAFLKRWIDSGGSAEALALIAGSAHVSRQSTLSWNQRYQIAVHHQSKLEL